MDVSQVPAGSIVVGVDGSAWSVGALDWAVGQAALEQRPLVIVHAIASLGAQSMGGYASSGLDFVQLLDDARTHAHQLLDGARAHALDREPGLDVYHLLSGSDPRTVLLDLGEHAAMIVVGSRGRGPVASLMLGSVSVSVARHASCPVIVRRAGEVSFPVHQILVGVDGTQPSLPAVEFAFRMASFRQSTLTVMHCYWTAGPIAVPLPDSPPPDLTAERTLVSESLAGMTEKFPEVKVSVRLVSGFADQQLIAASPDYDLVVVGHQRLGQLSDLISDSVAAAVLEHADGAIAVVPSHPRGPQITRGS